MIRLTPPAKNKRQKVVFHLNPVECGLLIKAVTNGDKAYPSELVAVRQQLIELKERLDGLERLWKAHPDAPNYPGENS